MYTCTVPGLFDIAAGSVTGRDHRLAGRNNQDAYHWACLPHAVMAVVCDGCGSGKHSEVGAQIGARLIIEAMTRALQDAAHAFWHRVRHDVLAQLRRLAEHMGGSLTYTVQDYLLFTVVGGLVTPWRTSCFSLGDGVLVVNGDQLSLGSFPDNAPPYLAYALLDTHNGSPPALSGEFQMQRILPTTAIQSILLGTDGLETFLQAAARPIPGKRSAVGPLQQFWQEERYFTNPDAVRRTLALVNREVVQPNWEAQRLDRQAGLLPDDTTLVVIRRRPVPGEEASGGRLYQP
jgi:protein phosphatase 2C-like protein